MAINLSADFGKREEIYMMWASPDATVTFVRPETRRRKSEMNKISFQFSSIGRLGRMKEAKCEKFEKDGQP
jgi:hypothetical protein